MILLCGIPSEGPLRLVVEAAVRQGVEYILFNQRETEFSDLFFEITNGIADGFLTVRMTDWPLSGFSGVYARLMDHHDLPENQNPGGDPQRQAAVLKSFLFHEALWDWLEITPCRVMNRASAMGSNGSKPYQAQIIARVGFLTPPTLITNNPQQVREFLRLHPRLIYKSISSIRSIVKELDAITINQLGKLRYLPTQFQAFIPGTNVRVHVVGEEVFATEVRTEAIDYRYATQDGFDVSMTPVELPIDIQARCLELSRLLDLPLCGIDLKRTPQGAYYCFEVNPSPGYSFYQEHSGQDIAAAIVRYLACLPQGTNRKSD